MKKKLSVTLVFLLIFSYALSGAALADVNVSSVSISGGGTATMGDSSITLTADVVSDYSDLEYMWFGSKINNSASFGAMGVNSSTYTPPQTAGTMYYCVGVRSSADAQWTYSAAVAVTYNNGTLGLNIINRPSKWQYYVGETINLFGLEVEISTAAGTWTSYNGADLSVSPRVLTAQGEVVVTVSYDGYSASFGVTVSPHNHSYSAWTVTKAASCTATGTRTRTCTCGATQTETIAKTAHSWNAGTVKNNVKTFTCTVCGATKTETVTASPSPSPSPTPTPTPTPTATPAPGTTGAAGTTGGTTGAAGTAGTTGTGIPGVNGSGTIGSDSTGIPGSTGAPNGTGGTDGTDGAGGTDGQSGGFKWWVIPLVAASVGVVAGGGAYMYLTFVKKE